MPRVVDDAVVSYPRGVGIYTRKLSADVYGGPREAATKAADNGLSFVCMFALWQEASSTRDPSDAIDRAYAEAFAARGLDVWAWGYPHVGRESEFFERMRRNAAAMGAKGVLLDPEKSYRRRRRAATRLVEMASALPEVRTGAWGLGVTSYSRLEPHGLEVLEELDGWLSPQVYTVPERAARRAIAAWLTDADGRPRPRRHVVASVPTFGPRSEGALGAYIGAIEDLVAGVAAWSWPSASPLEWRSLARWARRFEASSRA